MLTSLVCNSKVIPSISSLVFHARVTLVASTATTRREYGAGGSPLAVDGLDADGLAVDGLEADGLAVDGLAVDGLAADGLEPDEWGLEVFGPLSGGDGADGVDFVFVEAACFGAACFGLDANSLYSSANFFPLVRWS